MLENVLKGFGLDDFITVRKPIGKDFRPTATAFIDEHKDIFKEVESEYIETEDARNSYKNIVTLICKYTDSKIHKPIDLHPAWWNLHKVSSDVDWYNQEDTKYICFKDWNNKVNYFPAKISVILPQGDNLSWISYSGYAHDFDLDRAYMKAIYELIERDDFVAWWHKGLNIYKVVPKKNYMSWKMQKYITEKKLTCNLYHIPNEWGLFTIMCVIISKEFPKVSIGLGTNSNIELASQHAIDECVGTYKGHLWEALHGQVIISDLKSNEILEQIELTQKIKEYKFNSSLSLKELMKETQTYVACISSENGYTVKAFSTLLQPETLVDTTPFTSRLLLRTMNPLKKGIIPFG